VTEPSPWLDHAPWGMADHLVARLERAAREVADEWGLALGPRMAAGRFSYVAPAGPDAILKIIPVEDDDADHIAAALELWDGNGAVRLLRHDPARRALLLERLVPGTDAAAIGEDEATAVATQVGRQIWREPPERHPFRSVHDWVRRWMPADSVHPLVPVARRTYAEMRPRVDRVVHADFHHHNLLKRHDEWVVIDPKPLVGEPEFDIPAFLVNPIASAVTPERTERRIRAFVDAGLDRERIRLWAIVRGVLDGLPTKPGEPESRRLRMVRELL
jgi:streptomycin 6-kinase